MLQQIIAFMFGFKNKKLFCSMILDHLNETDLFLER